jgi:integrase
VAGPQKYRLASGAARYRVRWVTLDGRKHSRSFERRKDAERFASELRRRRALGTLYEAPPETLEEFLDGWLARYEQRVRPSSFVRRLEALPHLAPFLPLTTDRILPSDVEDHIANVGRRAPRQAQIALQTLKMVMANAKERGLVVNEAIFRLKAPRIEQRERRFLSWAEVDELSMQTVEPYGNLVRFAALTGLREGEIFALMDSRINWESDAVSVDYGAYRGELVPLKTRASRRAVDLSAEALRTLRAQLRARTPNELGLVFPSPEGKIWHRPPFLNRVFRPACKRAGLSGIAFHDIRHTYAALMIRAGAHTKYLQSQMGHESVRTTLDLYGHLFPDANRSVLEDLDRIVASAQGPLRDHRS